MAILWSRDRGKAGGQADAGANFFESHYVLRADTPTASQQAVLLSGLLPVYGSPHPENPLAVCYKVEVRRQASDPYLWEATALWNVNPESGNDPADDQLQPDLRRPKWQARFVPFPLARFVDLDGKLLADAAHTPFDPVPDIPIYVDEITVTRYEATVDRPTQRKYMGASNLDVWLGAEIGTALVDEISVAEEYLQGAYWFQTTYRILVKPRVSVQLPLGTAQDLGGWNPEYILNAGPMKLELVDGDLVKKPITHDDLYDGRPAFLKLDGTEIPINAGTGALTADPTFLEFRTTAKKTFANLNLTPPSGWTGV